jgi:hypothetical protein
MMNLHGLTPCTDDFSGKDELPIILSYTSKAVDEENATSESKERAEEDGPPRASDQRWHSLTNGTRDQSSDAHWDDPSSRKDGRVVKNVLEVGRNPELDDSEPALYRGHE